MKGEGPVDPALRLATPLGKAGEKTDQNGNVPFRPSSQRRDAFVKDYLSVLIPRDELLSSIERALDFELDHGSEVYCPPEWNALTMKTRAKLTNLLSWDNLSQWDFNIVDVSEFASVDRISPPVVGGIAPVIDDGFRAQGEAVVVC